MYPGVFSFKGSLLTSVLSYDLVRIVSGHHSVLELYLILNYESSFLSQWSSILYKPKLSKWISIYGGAHSKSPCYMEAQLWLWSDYTGLPVVLYCAFIRVHTRPVTVLYIRPYTGVARGRVAGILTIDIISCICSCFFHYFCSSCPSCSCYSWC